MLTLKIFNKNFEITTSSIFKNNNMTIYKIEAIKLFPKIKHMRNQDIKIITNFIIFFKKKLKNQKQISMNNHFYYNKFELFR